MALVTLALLLGATLWLYRDTVAYLVSIWNQVEEGEYGHGYLVLGICVYLIYRQRERLLNCRPASSLVGLVGLLGLSALWLVGALADVMVVQAAALVLMPLALASSVLGWSVTRYLVVPLGFLLFAVPLWSVLSPALQSFTQEIVYAAVRALGVPALAREHVIVLPYGELAIEEACSGLRYLLAALTLSVLYAYLNYQSLGARLLVVAISAVAAVFANLLRVFTVVYLGYTSQMQHPLVHDHLMLGWYIFGGVVFVLLAIDVVLARRRHPISSATASAAAPVAGAMRSARPSSYGSAATASALAFAAVAAGPVLLHWTQSAAATAEQMVSLTLPTAAEGWAGPVASDDDWQLAFGEAHTTGARYENGADAVYVNVAYYPSQTQGRELISELNHIADKRTWSEVYPRGRVATATDNIVVLEQLLRHDNGRKRLVWYWYEVAGRSTVSALEGKIFQVWGALRRDTRGTVVAMAMNYEDDPAAARAKLATFLAPMRSELAADAMLRASNPKLPNP